MGTLFWLIAGHALGDFSLQSDAMAKGKNRNRDVSHLVPPGQTLQKVWPFYLSAHALIMGSLVALATGSIVLGVCETITHWLIDFGKCDNRYGIYCDQAMHLTLKLVWFLIAITGVLV